MSGEKRRRGGRERERVGPGVVWVSWRGEGESGRGEERRVRRVRGELKEYNGMELLTEGHVACAVSVINADKISALIHR